MADGRIIILVDADTKGYDKAFSEMTATAKSSSSKVSSTLTSAADKLSSFGSKATKALTLPIAAAGTASVAAAISIDTSLTNVKKTVDGTAEQYQQLKDAAIKFSRTNAVSASQILDLQSLGAQLGFAITELDEFSRVASGLDIATDMDAETAASEMAQFANITRMAHEDISRYGSSIVALGNNLATTESKVSSMGQRIAAAGTQTKMSQAEILGWAGAMSSLGVEAEAGGTAFSTTISTIDAAVAKGGEDLQTFAKIAGMSSKQFADSWKSSASDTMVSLLKSVNGAENMTIALEEMGVTGIRQSDVLKRLAGNTDLVSQAIDISNKGWQENTALTNEVANRNESLAAKFEMLKNRGIEMLEKVGTPLANALLDVADAAEPVIEGIGEVAEAFSNADEGTQRTILGAVALVAALGPVATVSGKVLKAVDLLRTGHTKLSSAMKVSNATFITSAGVVSKYDKTTKSYVTTNSKLVKSLGTSSAGMKVQSAAVGAANVTMKAGTTIARTFGSALKTIAPLAALGVVVGVISSIGDAMEDAKEKAETYEKATTGLVSSMKAMNDVDVSGFTKAGQEMAGVSETVTKSFSEVMQAQADFATQSAETWGEINGQSAAISAFADTIAELTQGQKLGTEEQARLAAAVAGYNELTGQSVQIIDLENGKLDTSTAKIMENAAAWKRNAEMQALQQELVTLYTQLHDAQDQYAQAQERTAQAQADYDEAVRNGSADIASYKAVLDQAKAGEEQAKAVLDSSNESIDQRVQKLGEVALQQTASSQAIQEFIEKNKELKGSLEDVDLETFSGALSQLGFDTATLNQVGSENIKALAANFQGSTQDLINYCSKAGIEIPGKLSDGIYQGTDGVTLAAGSLAAQVYGELTGQDYTQTGAFVTQGMAQGIWGDMSAKLAAAGMGEETIAALKTALGVASPSTKAASAGGFVGQGLANGISGDTSADSAASAMGASVIASLTAELKGAEQVGTDTGTAFSSALEATGELAKVSGDLVAGQAQTGMSSFDKFNAIGTTSGTKFSAGVGSTTGTARSKGNAVAAASKVGMTMFAAFSSVGSQSGDSFASGVGSKDDAARTSGGIVADGAQSGMKKHNSSANTWGRHLVENFSQGIRNAQSLATGAGSFIANAVKSVMGFSVPKKGPWSGAEKGGETSGRHLVENFATGMLTATSAVLRSAQTVEQKLYDQLSNLDSPTVPIDIRFSNRAMADKLSSILNGGSVAKTISGSMSVDIFGKRLESIESHMVAIESRLESIDRGIGKVNESLKQPMDINWNKRELARLVRSFM